MDLQIRIGTAVDNTPTELSFVIWIIEIDDRERDPRISTRVLRFPANFRLYTVGKRLRLSINLARLRVDYKFHSLGVGRRGAEALNVET